MKRVVLKLLYSYIQEAMTKVKFQRVLSFSSEHPTHKAENLISGVPSTSGSKKVGAIETYDVIIVFSI